MFDSAGRKRITQTQRNCNVKSERRQPETKADKNKQRTNTKNKTNKHTTNKKHKKQNISKNKTNKTTKQTNNTNKKQEVPVDDALPVEEGDRAEALDEDLGGLFNLLSKQKTKNKKYLLLYCLGF